MKKLIKSYSVYLKPVILYIDDLDKILEYFKEVSDTIIIQTNEYELTDIEEIKNINNDKLKYLYISTSNQGISLNIDNNVSIYISEDTPILRGALEKIKQYLSKRQRKLMFILDNVVVYNLFVILTIYVVSTNFKKGNIYLGVFGICCLIIEIIWVWVNLKSDYHSIIYLKKKNDYPNFFKRNKDKLIIVIITAILTLVTTLILQPILNKIFRI